MIRERVTARLERVDRERLALLDAVGALPPGRRTARPIPGKWSVLEIVEHLVLAERDVLLRTPDPSAPPPRPDLSNRLAYLVVMAVLRFDIPVKVPSEAMIPGGQRDLDTLRRMWDDNHAVLRGRIAAMDDDALRRPVAVHPVAGPMTVAQAVRMLEVHLHRHQRQIHRRMALLADSTGTMNDGGVDVRTDR